MKKSHKLNDARATIFKALAHPTRLFLIDMLSRQEKCVCEMTDAVGADISTVSKHLSVLKQAGIVADEKRGLQVYYTLTMPCVLTFFNCIKSALQKSTPKQKLMLK